MHVEAGMCACGAIEYNQARKLDKNKVFTHVYITFNDILIGNFKVLPMLVIAKRQHEIELCRNTPNMSNHVSVETLY